MTYDPNRPDEGRVYSETVETVVVREPSNAAQWWIAGLLGLVAVILLVWLFVGRQADTVPADQLSEAAIQAELDQARLAGELGMAERSADIARSDAMRATAEAQQAAAEARAAQAQAEATPRTVIIERPGVTQAPPVEVNEPVVTPPTQ
jgi:hypothetical protein